jgi:hypothetical protein
MATLGALTMLVFRLLLGNVYRLDQGLDGSSRLRLSSFALFSRPSIVR